MQCEFGENLVFAGNRQKVATRFSNILFYFGPEMETTRVDRSVGLPVGSRFFDRPVKPVETPVKFSFLQLKDI